MGKFNFFRRSLILVLITLIFGFTFLYTQNLPFDHVVKDDFYLFYYSLNTSFGDLSRFIFIELLDFTNLFGLDERPIPTLFIKTPVTFQDSGRIRQ